MSLSAVVTPLDAPGGPAQAPASAPVAARPVGEQIAEGLVAAGHLTPEQRRSAQRVFEKVRATRTLSAVLIELRYVTHDQIRDALRRHDVRVRLGDLLVELGLLSNGDLKLALAMQRQQPETPIGEILTANHFVSEADVLATLADTLGFTRVDLDAAELDPRLFKRAPSKVYRTHEFVPLPQDDGRVLVVFADPLDQVHLSAARVHFGSDMVIGLAGRRMVLSAITRIEKALADRVSAVQVPDSPAVAQVTRMLEDAVAGRVSDIHIEPHSDGLRVRFRQDGVMVPQAHVPAAQAAALIGRIKVLAGADIAERRRHQDGRFRFESTRGSVDLRVSIYATVHGEQVVLRLLNNRSTLLSLKDLGMAPRTLHTLQTAALEAPSGVILVTGPTGSGKTTTLYAAVNYLNDATTSIITAEDPVEYVIEGISQCSINPKIDLSYADTLRHIVRQDPDVIVIGEIRDEFSADVAVNAALTGHKVLTTFHTEDTIGGLIRLLNMNIDASMVASTVLAVLAQRLVRRVCPRCAENHVLTPAELARLGYRPGQAEGLTFARGQGCQACRQVGYKGRVAIFELLMVTDVVRDAVLARQSAFDIRRICIEDGGLVTLVEDGIVRAAAGQTTFEEIIRQLPRLSRPRPLAELRRLVGAAS